MSVKASRLTVFQQCYQETEPQRLAGAASWAAFSARSRAHQGLPLLHPMDVQYLAPQDFRNGLGQPLPPTEQNYGVLRLLQNTRKREDLYRGW